MRLRKLKLKNIRSYENAEINFPEGSILLSGDVGSGKTSILLAIEYALFGLQPGQKGSALLRNRENTGEVKLELEIDGNDVIIERRLKRSSKAVTNDYAAVTINNEKFESSITEIKTRILRLLQYPAEFVKKTNILYKYTVYTPQEEMKQIILEEPEARLNILRHVFGIDKYKKVRENLAIVTTKLKEDSKILQGEIKELEEEKSLLTQKRESVDSIQKKIDEKQKEVQINREKRKGVETEAVELEVKIKEKERFEKEVEKTIVLINSKRENIATAEKEIDELERKISGIGKLFDENELSKIIAETTEKKQKLESLNASYFDVTSQANSLNLVKKDIATNKDRIFGIDLCPVCLQNVPEAHKHNIFLDSEKKIAEINKTLSSLDERKREVFGYLEKEKSALTEMEEQKIKLEILKVKTVEIESSKKKLFEIKKTNETVRNDIASLTNHVNSLKQAIIDFSKYDNLFKLKKDELKEAFIAEKNSEIAAAELKKELELTKKEISLLEKKVQAKEESKEKLMKTFEMHGWLSNQFLSLVNFTERNIMIKLRKEFSALFSKWFSMLTTDSFEVQLDENFTPVVMQQDVEMDYSFLSGGERTAIALAYRLALNQTINSILSRIRTMDIVVLDEPTDGFSEHQLDKMRDVLQELNVGQLVIVSHEQKMEGFVDHVLRVKKTHGSATIE